MSLQEYRAKRDFKKTREPKGLKAHSLEKNLFVVQKHFASHLHYDFRLEMSGTLKSWAVPKGPSLNPQDKRLAVEVEDHPLSYVHFEGEIPADEYGGGQVIVWDTGTWDPPKNAAAQLKKGRLEFELHGEKLKGRWILVRTSARGKSKKHNWLLIKRHDESVSTEDILLQDESVLDQVLHKKKTKPAQKEILKKSPIFKFEEPQLAFLVDAPPVGPEWIHEIKYDGYRTLCRKDKSTVVLQTRSGLDWTKKYPELAEECKKIKAKSFILDGEIAWIDDQGHTQFDGLQNALSEGNTEDLVYYLFDILYLNGVDVRSAPLIERKKLLAALIKQNGSSKLVYSDHWTEAGSSVLNSACQHDLEGIISKNKNSAYDTGRSKNWLKSKCKKNQEFVIGGYTLQDNKSLGALLVGGYDDKKNLQYAGRVGTGFDQKTSTTLLSKLKKLTAQASAFDGKIPSGYRSVGKTALWVKPQLVANIEFGAWTQDHILRHAAFKGLREDKKAQTVKLDEIELAPTKVSKKASAPELKKSNLTHPEKILFPQPKLTKQDLADYYEQIQKWILPFVEDRALSLLRCPNGQGKTCFFQKHLETEGHGLIKTKIKAPLHKKSEDVTTLNTYEGLHQLVQMGNLEIHSRGGTIKNPDYANLVVFDLDPDPGVTFKDVKSAALDLKSILDQLKLVSFVKTSGGKGLHIHVPIKDNTYTWDEIKNFSKSVCEQMVKMQPNKYTVNILKKNRKGKIFLDYLRNGYGATAITAYSVRAHPNASVALPLAWKEIPKLKAPDQYTLKNVPQLLKKRSDPWHGYFKQNQKIKILDQAKNQKTRGET